MKEAHAEWDHERDPPAARVVGWVLAATAALVVLVAAGVWFVFTIVWPAPDAGSGRTEPARIAAPVAEERLSRAAHEKARAQRAAHLGRYGWLDRSAGTVHVPVEVAMREMVRSHRAEDTAAPVGSDPR